MQIENHSTGSSGVAITVFTEGNITIIATINEMSMPKFGRRSKNNLIGVNGMLVEILKDAIQYFDFSVVCGRRTREQQKKLYLTGKSRTLISKHCCGLAVDLCPYPIPPNYGDLKSFKDLESQDELIEMCKARASFYYMSGIVLRSARELGCVLRWGGDWKGNQNFFENNFDDLVHFELLDY